MNRMVDGSQVTIHYGRSGIFEAIGDRLAEVGLGVGDIGRDQLAGVDEFHLGGRAATDALLDDLDVAANAAVLDVGCGIGGLARAIAERTAATVHGVDLTPEFVEAATRLSELTGVADRTDFRVGSALDLPFDADRFDVVTMVHVGMNIHDKPALARELSRVVRPGGCVAIYDIMRLSEGELTYPVPWATDESTSFLAGPRQYVDALTDAGLMPSEPQNRIELVRAAVERSREQPAPVDLRHLMGSDWPTMFGNLGTALAGGTVAPIQVVATAPGRRGASTSPDDGGPTATPW